MKPLGGISQSAAPFNQAAVAITGGTAYFDDGTVTVPSIGWASDADGTGTGFYRRSTNTIDATVNGVATVEMAATRFGFNSGVLLGWSSSASTVNSSDTTLSRQSQGLVAVDAATATPAGGATTLGLVFGSTAGFGIYIGSGVPTLSAAQGSLYLRSDGSSTSTRLYVNTNGTTGWTNVTTAT